MGKTSLLSKFEGCLLGVAIGDALGAPVEGKSPHQIKNRFGILREMVAAPWRGFPAGGHTDDTALMLCIARVIAERGDFHPEDAAQRFLLWFDTDRYGIGMTTLVALTALKRGASWTEAGRIAHERLGGLSAGNGSIMRCAPIALRYFKDEERLIRASRESSIITHWDKIAQEGCVALNLAIIHLLTKDKQNLPQNILPKIREPRTKEALAEVVSLKKDDLFPSGFALDTLRCALWCFLHTEGFEQALVEAINLGGDADTIGAVCGALSGAFYGREGIPLRWLEAIKVKEEVLQLAARIYTIAISSPST